MLYSLLIALCTMYNDVAPVPTNEIKTRPPCDYVGYSLYRDPRYCGAVSAFYFTSLLYWTFDIRRPLHFPPFTHSSAPALKSLKALSGTLVFHIHSFIFSSYLYKDNSLLPRQSSFICFPLTSFDCRLPLYCLKSPLTLDYSP
jgi:hypothetical protein